MKLTADDLLVKLRVELLQERATGSTGFGLSHAAHLVAPDRKVREESTRKRLTSGVPKELRGMVQLCLTRLAHAGLLYTRRKPEGAVPPYGHCETDKRFLYRVSQAEAIELLARMNIPVRPCLTVGSGYWTPSLGVETRDQVLTC